MSAIERVTFVIYTFEWPQFLIRLIRYFDSVGAEHRAPRRLKD